MERAPFFGSELATSLLSHLCQDGYLDFIGESLHSAESVDKVLLLEDLHSCHVLCSSSSIGEESGRGRHWWKLQLVSALNDDRHRSEALTLLCIVSDFEIIRRCSSIGAAQASSVIQSSRSLWHLVNNGRTTWCPEVRQCRLHRSTGT